MLSRHDRLSEPRMRELLLLPSSITCAACFKCLHSRDTYKCTNQFLCRDFVAGSVSELEQVIKNLRLEIWKENGSPSQRRKCLVNKLRENITTGSDGDTPVINYFINGVKICKSYFKVSNVFDILFTN